MAAFRENKIFTAWIVFFLIALVGGFILGAVAGAIAGAVVMILTGSKDAIPFYAGLAGFLAGIPVSYLSFRFAVQKFLATADSVQG